MNWKRPTLTLLFLLPLLPLAAQERVAVSTVMDTAYVFRFVLGKDMFYLPFGENGRELQRLQECVELHKDDILTGKTPLHVDGYCNSVATERENLAIAKTRSNRVKSELITRSGLTDACFVTRNHSDGGDYVTVCLVVPVRAEQTEDDSAAIERKRAEQSRLEAERLAAERAEKERLAQEQAAREQPEKEAALKAERERLAVEKQAAVDDYNFALHSNLLRWATLTPDLCIEWRIYRHVGILVNGSWTSWSWDNENRRYALWKVAPEVRWYLGKEKHGYIGAMYKTGQFNYKLSATGKQGDLLGGGIVGGYQLKLNKALSMGFSLGIGCLHADYEKYTIIDGVQVRAGKETKNWWGPVSAGVTLVWKLF